MVLFCRKKGPRMWKGWLEYYLDFFGCCCFLLLNFYLLFTCALTHIQKCTDTHRNIERQNSSLKAKRTHTAGKKILKIESVCGVFTFPFYFRNYFYVSYVRALTCTMVGTPCARNVFFSSLRVCVSFTPKRRTYVSLRFGSDTKWRFHLLLWHQRQRKRKHLCGWWAMTTQHWLK